MPTTSNFGWTTPADTDLVKDGALAIRTLGNGIDTSMAQLKGGTTGQVLSKTSNTDMAFTWVTQDDANAIQNAIVDAKGDLIAATANDTPARLAVGNNGETLVADSSATTGLRWQTGNGLSQGVINGGMEFWQRGTSFALTTPSTAYTADRWLGRHQGTNVTYSQQTSGLTGFQYSLRVQRPNGVTGTNDIAIYYNSETADSYRFAGKTVTFSFYAKAGANFSSSGSALGANIYTGTGTNQNITAGAFTGQTYAGGVNATLTTSWQRFTATATFGSSITQFALIIAYSPTGTAGANDWFEITGLQLEEGSVATPFRRSGGTLAGELAACQRYYVRQGGQSLYQRLANGAFQSSTTAYIQFPHPVTMRVAPTSVDFSTMALNDYNSTIAATNITIDFAGGSMTSLAVTVASGGTQYRPVQLLTNNSTSAYVGLSAEL